MRQFRINQIFTNRTNHSINDIMNYISQHPHNKEKEIELYDRLMLNDETAKEELFLNNLSFVFSVCKSYESTTIPLEDIFQEGCIGLKKAVDKFEPRKGMKFITYAIWWIRESIIVSLNVQKTGIYIPENVSSKAQKFIRIQNEFAQQNGFLPDLNYIAEQLGLKKDMVEGLSYFLTKSGCRLSDEIVGTDSLIVEDSLESDIVTDQFSDEEYNKHLIQTLLNHLSDKHQKIVKMYYGIDCYPVNISDIAEQMHIQRERVRQIIRQSEQKMKLIYSRM